MNSAGKRAKAETDQNTEYDPDEHIIIRDTVTFPDDDFEVPEYLQASPRREIWEVQLQLMLGSLNHIGNVILYVDGRQKPFAIGGNYSRSIDRTVSAEVDPPEFGQHAVDFVTLPSKSAIFARLAIFDESLKLHRKRAIDVRMLNEESRNSIVTIYVQKRTWFGSVPRDANGNEVQALIQQRNKSWYEIPFGSTANNTSIWVDTVVTREVNIEATYVNLGPKLQLGVNAALKKKACFDYFLHASSFTRRRRRGYVLPRTAPPAGNDNDESDHGDDDNDDSDNPDDQASGRDGNKDDSDGKPDNSGPHDGRKRDGSGHGGDDGSSAQSGMKRRRMGCKDDDQEKQTPSKAARYYLFPAPTHD